MTYSPRKQCCSSLVAGGLAEDQATETGRGEDAAQTAVVTLQLAARQPCPASRSEPHSDQQSCSCVTAGYDADTVFSAVTSE